jgi:peptidyl-prolyl cis-trans isomerase A (cyclophilin A)
MALMKIPYLLLFVGVAAMAQTPPPSAPKTAPAKTSPAKTASTTPRPNLLDPASFRATAPAVYRVKLSTTHGDFVVEVHRDWAPVGADHFYNMVKSGYLVNSSFYRFVPNFIVQFGMAPDPAVNAAWDKMKIKDDPVKQGNKKGTVVFASTGQPNSRTTQLFVNLRDNNASLDGLGFAAFGTVTEGMEVVEGLYSGYGEIFEQGGRGPSQQAVEKQGKAYLDKSFPKLDSIKSATILPASPAAAPGAPTAAAPPKKQ